ncbi:hypothetical protein ABEB36_000775 [Hypothenemus hampei]|uniref:Uncharacterized protein n=1 Tax=Hypothenemus hampei TaxID=57062 RepID=A0ABD1FFZ3_HYPHA
MNASQTPNNLGYNHQNDRRAAAVIPPKNRPMGLQSTIKKKKSIFSQVTNEMCKYHERVAVYLNNLAKGFRIIKKKRITQESKPKRLLEQRRHLYFMTNAKDHKDN